MAQDHVRLRKVTGLTRRGTALVLLTMLLSTGFAKAATVVGPKESATGIANLMYSYGGTDYRFNVEFFGNASYESVFASGVTPYFQGDPDGARAARDAMIDFLNAEGVTGISGLTIPVPGTPAYDFYNQTGLFLAIPNIAPYNSGQQVSWAAPQLTTTGGANPVLTGWAPASGGFWSTSEAFDFLAWVKLEAAPTVEGLLDALREMTNGVGPGKSLANKVTDAQTYYAVPDEQATCAVLTAFVNEVRAQRGKKIKPATLADQLIADAQAIMTAIGCD